jgi:hypothetical protein
MAQPAALLLALAVIGATACVRRVETSTSTIEVEQLRREDALRVALNLPDSFVVVTPASTARDCPPALREQGRDTRLTLRRSLLIQVQDSAGVVYRPFGDYALEPAGQYGEQPGEGLRVDCGSRRGVGIVTLLVRKP